jgi:hypothetical protein
MNNKATHGAVPAERQNPISGADAAMILVNEPIKVTIEIDSFLALQVAAKARRNGTDFQTAMQATIDHSEVRGWLNDAAQFEEKEEQQ